jgi:hypothetical protein
MILLQQMDLLEELKSGVGIHMYFGMGFLSFAENKCKVCVFLVLKGPSNQVRVVEKTV